MAKMTFLEIVQDILNDIDGDEVNSIDDTTESTQIAQIVKTTYFELIDARDWPHTQKLIQIEPSGDNNLPCIMTLQDPIKKIKFVNYDKAKLQDGSRRLFDPVRYLEPDDFIRKCNHRNNTDPNCITMVDPNSGIPFTIRNDCAPTHYTTYDDKNLIFDSYDHALDDTLQQHKVQVFAYIIPTWNNTDNAVPDLPDAAFSLLLEEAKSRASFKIRQQPDQKAEQESQRQRKWLARNDRRVKGGIKFPDYGRAGCGIRYYKDPTFRRDNE